MINNLYTSKTYEWNNNKGLGENHLSKFKKLNIEDFKNNKQILFFVRMQALTKDMPL